MIRQRLGSEERRKAIVEAAMPLFARKGFAGTTTREIARSAGVSEALLFQHFPSKVAIYQAIVALGCEGDPCLEQLAAEPPSTATLVHVTRGMLEHFVLGSLGDPVACDVQHRLTLNSFLEDGGYAGHLFGWAAEEVLPIFVASMAAAERVGDLVPGARFGANQFWFAEHVAAMIAYARLPGSSAVPYRGDVTALMDDALRFILRGFGLTEAAIEHHLAEESAPAPQAAV